MDAVVDFLTSWVSISMYAVIAAGALLMWALVQIVYESRLKGGVALCASIALFAVGIHIGLSLLKPPFCPPGERLHGAAGRVLWCAP